ncbi:glycosyltransferase [Candidatus Pseudothioglobus singularis]|nr:glycosyltransferase [Candidatus Pseudothioglobus singularis]
MKLLHVIPHINEEAAGPSYSVPRLCQSLAFENNKVELSCLASNDEIPKVRLKIHSEWPILKKFAISTSLTNYVRKKSKGVDIVHNHSLWSMVNISTGWVVSSKYAKLVTSPRGTLSSWALSQNRLSKKLLWPLQRRILIRSDLIHATSQAEYEDIRSNGFNNPVAIIPNGIDLPKIHLTTLKSEQKVLLFLGRLHPTKCVNRLLLAWKNLQDIYKDWDLLIVGKGNKSYEKELMRMTEDLDLKRVKFTGALFGDDKSRIFFSADLFILPSHSENFGIAVAEALAHCCPAIVSKGAPWASLEKNECGWSSDNDVNSLTNSLNLGMSHTKAKLNEMGQNGRNWMEDKYNWDQVGFKMNASYRWLIEGGDCPDWIKLS